MKKSIKIAAVLALASFATASAQMTYSGYFLDNYTYRFQMNPAFANEDNFVSFPALGNMNIGFQGNLHLTSVLYNIGGKTVLFTNPDVSASQVLSKVKNNNRLGFNTKIDILSGGFKAWGGYNTVSIGAVARANVKVPKSLFQIAKEPIQNETYSIRDMRAQATGYIQLAFNHSRDIKEVPGLRAGAAMKFYIGGANIDAYFDKADLTLGKDSWTGITNANIYSSIRGLRFKTDYNDKSGKEYFNGFDGDFKGLNGFGIGFDLGASYHWNDFDFSLAILDLGFISWGKTQWASTNGDQMVDTDNYIFNADGSLPNSFDNEWDRLSGDVSQLYQLTVNKERGSRTRAVAATLNLGVEYEFPYYRPLHFGFVSSTVINGQYSWSQARFSANVAPLDWISASANLEASTFGCGFGWLLNFYHKGINVFLGMDHTMGKMAKQGVPLNSNGSFNFGINFPF